MLIHHYRNATMVVSAGARHFYGVPMLSARGVLPSLKWLTLHRRRNPTADLPKNATDMLAQVTRCLITHCRKGHFDHLGSPALKYLIDNRLPVYCSGDEAQYPGRRHLTVLPLADESKQLPPATE